MKIKHLLLLLLVTIQSCKSQKSIDVASTKSTFLQEQIEIGTPIWNYLRSNPYTLNSLNETDFTHKIDSLKSIYEAQLNTYRGKLDKTTFNDETLSINYAFDKFILEYPQNHENFTGEKIALSKKNQYRLSENLKKFNDINLLSNEALTDYVASYISIESNKKLKNGTYDKLDNQQLAADWNTIETTFTNQDVNDFWKQKYLYNHIDNLGIKNIDKFYTGFITSCKTQEYTSKIRSIYDLSKKARASHPIEIYKKVDGFELEMHLFLPDTSVFKGNRPTIVYFHGGSWSEGKPDWFFETAKEYAKLGWVATAVEYRIKGRQGTYPFEAVKDAKSAIRWLRENSKNYNIDPNKIVAIGNSAGGHLSIATTLVDHWNEKTDDTTISPIPNVVIVNSAVYDVTSNSNKWITEYDENKDLVKEISPNNLIKKTVTKFLLIHGEQDRNCPYSTTVYFYEKMKSLGNNVELHSIKEGSHWIWYDKNSKEVARITREYIEKLDY
ncbi:alpha/beta hydrolase family protein [Aureibaculum luteum]|uniref:alpha/beta hydrolase family protein n=1 Tax=Aureibaculum luteum TaxID=1548456 RepID=UPI000E55513F|nr:alpha/beta hydrolase fold domain-containing protein [Aureibaculum luteum]